MCGPETTLAKNKDIVRAFIDALFTKGDLGAVDDYLAAYYGSQPVGLTAAYRILETRRPADNLVFGYLDVDFSFTDRATLRVNLGVLVTRLEQGWYISHYQVSQLGQEVITGSAHGRWQPL